MKNMSLRDMSVEQKKRKGYGYEPASATLKSQHKKTEPKNRNLAWPDANNIQGTMGWRN